MQFYVKSKVSRQGIAESDVILVLDILQMNGEVKLLVVDTNKDLWWMDYTQVSFLGIANPDAIVYHNTKSDEQVELIAPSIKKPFGRK